MLLKLIKSQSGFSIVQGLILASAVAGMAYVGTILMNEQKLAQRGVQARTNNERLHEMIYSLLQNKDHCTTTLVANGFGTDAVAPFGLAENGATLSLGEVRVLTQIRPLNSAAAPFTAKAGATYTSAEKYMNGTLGIQSMSITMPTGTFENPASLQIAYERIGQGFMGKTINKIIAIKIQNDASGRFQSCYAIETGTNQDLVKNFCTTLGTDDGNASTVDSIFEWDPATNSCKLKDLRCPVGQIYTGFDSSGVRRCHTIQQWSNLGNFIDTAASANCAPGNAPNVRFVFTTGSKMKVDCGATSGGCTSHCQCGVNQKCSAGTCVPVGGTCVNGETGNGGTCDFICSGGYWACSASPYSCSPNYPDGTPCIMGGSDPDAGIVNCSECLNAPSALDSRCCDALSGFQMKYGCGMPGMMDCWRPTDNYSQPFTPAPSAPPSYECDT